MSKTRKSLVVPALAAASLLFGSVLATPAAAQGDRNNSHHESLVNISDNNVGPIQICHNNIPVNAVGVQVPLQDLLASLGIAGEASGNVKRVSKNCIQVTNQNGKHKPPEDKPPEDKPPEDKPPEDKPPEHDKPEHEKPEEEKPEEEPDAPEVITLPSRIDTGR